MQKSNSVCLKKKFTDLKKFTKEQLEKEALAILENIGYIPQEIEFGVPNKGVLNEIRIPVVFNEELAMQNWSKKYYAENIKQHNSN